MSKILVADDDTSIRYLITETLNLYNEHEVFEAKNGQIALETIIKETPDLILLDYMMPLLSGEDIILKIRELNLNPKIIMITAKAQKDDIKKAQNLNIDCYITKPFSPLELYEIVTNILNNQL